MAKIIEVNSEEYFEEPHVVIFGENMEVMGEYFWVPPNDITAEVLRLDDEERLTYLDALCRAQEEALKTISTLALNRKFFLNNLDQILGGFKKVRLTTSNEPETKPIPKRLLN